MVPEAKVLSMIASLETKPAKPYGETEAQKRNAHAGDGQGADHHRPEGHGQLVAQAAVIAHVLLVVHPVDHRTRAQGTAWP
jgi:hypothetical protein